MERLQGWRRSMNHLRFQAQFCVCVPFFLRIPTFYQHLSVKNLWKGNLRDHLIQSFINELKQTGKQMKLSRKINDFSIFVGNLWIRTKIRIQDLRHQEMYFNHHAISSFPIQSSNSLNLLFKSVRRYLILNLPCS